MLQEVERLKTLVAFAARALERGGVPRSPELAREAAFIRNQR